MEILGMERLNEGVTPNQLKVFAEQMGVTNLHLCRCVQ